ncbi:hypothetical protein B5S31_g2640 [[Candida] boidinii]|nr:hypothetical protein B5S31_g2640 [[Candida] boidinii]GME70507.1 unnamed protein product [[Candida] boidinii]
MSFKDYPEVIAELRKSEERSCEYPKFKYLMSYSQVGLYDINFNRDGLPIFDPPLELFRGANERDKITLSKGVDSYVPRFFAQDEARLSNIMRCMIYYEYQVIKRKINKDIKVIGNTGMLQDLTIQRDVTYKIFSYDGQIFIAPADRRIYEPRKVIYSSKKFVQIMTNKNGKCDGSHCKNIQEVDLGNGEFKVLAASEIDCFLDKTNLEGIEVGVSKMTQENKEKEQEEEQGEEEQGEEEQGEEEQEVIYIELRSMLCRGFRPQFFKVSPYLFLQKLHALRHDSWLPMFKILLKCTLYNQKLIIFGIRDDNFKQLGIKLVSISTLTEFLKNSSTRYYNMYTSAIETINFRLKQIVELVKDGEVYQLDISPTSYDLYPLPQRLWKQEMNKLVIKEFREWREKGIVSEDIKKGKSYDRQLDALVKEGEDYYLMKMVRHLERLGLHDRIDTEDTES